MRERTARRPVATARTEGRTSFAFVLTTSILCAISVARSAERSVPAATAHHASVDSRVYPWSSLVKLFNSVGGSCTGAVIARDRVLTAGHCVYASRTRRFLPPDTLHVLVGYQRGDYRLHARVLRYHVGPGYDPQAERHTAADDWAILELAEPLPPDVRPLKPALSAGAPGDRVALAGFARDQAYVMTADQDCRLLGPIEAGLMSHDCVIEPGDSGAPLLRRDEGSGEAGVVGIAIGIWHRGPDDVGIAALVPAELLPQNRTP